MESHLVMDFLTPLTLRTLEPFKALTALRVQAQDIKALTALRVQALEIKALMALKVQAPDIRVNQEEPQDLDAAELNSILGRRKMVPMRVMHHMMSPTAMVTEILETCLNHS